MTASDYKHSTVRPLVLPVKVGATGTVKQLRHKGKEKGPNAANALTGKEEEMLWFTNHVVVINAAVSIEGTSRTPFNGR